MTSIGTVFVNVQPDTSQFTQKLRGDLSRVTEDVQVKVTPDTSTFAQKLRAELTRASAEDIKVKVVPDTAAFTQRMRADLARASAEDIKVKVIPDTAQFTQRLRADLARVTEDVKVKVAPDTGQFAQKLRAELTRVTENVKVKVTPDTSGFTQKLRADLSRVTEEVRIKVVPDTVDFAQRLRAALAGVGVDLKINVQPDMTGFREAVRRELDAISASMKLTIKVNADSDHLRTEVSDAIRRAEAGQRINIPMNATGGLGGAGGGASGVTGILGGLSGVPAAGMAAAYASAAVAATGLAGAAVALVGALAPVAALMGSAIPAAAVGAAAAFGAVGSAFAGVMGALKAYGTMQKSASTDAQSSAKAQQTHANAIRSATNQVSGAQDALSQAYSRAARTREESARAITVAERNLAQTSSDAGDANAQAARQVEDAERQLGQAQAASRQAQQDLNDARQQAIEDLDNMRRSLRQTALDERGGVLSVEEAQKRLNEVRRDPTADNLARERAKLSYDQAVAGLDDTRDRLKDQQVEYGKASKAGVDGSSAVRAAQQSAGSATNQLVDAQRALTDAQQNQGKTAQKGQQAIADAQQAVSDAFRNQAQASEDSARSIKQSQQGLIEAQQALAQAMADTATSGTSNANKFADAMAKLSPIGRELVNTIISMQPAWENLQHVSQEAMFPGVLDMIHSISGTLPNLTTIVQHTSAVIGGLARDFGAMFASPAWQRDIRTVGDANAAALDKFGHAGLGLLDIFRNLTAAAAPYVTEFAEATRQTVESWKAQVESARQTGKLNELFDKAKVTGKELGQIFGNTWSGLWKILQLGYPYGKQILDLIEGWSAKFKEWTKTAAGQQQINDFFHGSVLIFHGLAVAVGLIAATLGGVVAQFGRLGDSLKGADTGLAEFGKQVGGFVYEQVRLLGDLFIEIAPLLLDFAKFFGTSILPVLAEFGRTVSDGLRPIISALGKTLHDDVFPALKMVSDSVLHDVIPAFGDFLRTMGSAISDVLPVLGNLLKNHIAPGLVEIGKDIHDVILPAFGALAKFISTELVPALAKVLGPVIDGVRNNFRALRDVINENKGHFESFYRAVKPVIDFIRDYVAPVLGVVLKGALVLTIAPMLLMIRIYGLIAGAIGNVIEWFKKLPGNIVKAAGAIGDFFERLPGRIAGFLGDAGRWMLGVGTKIVGGFVSGLGSAAGAIWDFFKRLPGRIGSFLGDAGHWLLHTGPQIIGGLASGLASAAGAVWRFFQGLPGRIEGYLKDAGKWLLKSGWSILVGLANGIASAAGAVWDFFKRLPGRIWGFLKDANRWLIGTGLAITGGLVHGVGAAAGGIWDFFKKLPGRIWGFVKDAGGWLLGVGKSIINGLASGLGTAWGAITGWFKSLPGTIASFFKDAGSWLVNVGKDIGRGLINGIIDFINGAIDALVNAPAKAINKAIPFGDPIPEDVDVPDIPHLATGGVAGAKPKSATIQGPTQSGLVMWAEQSTGGEAYIPLTADKAQRERSIEIWKETGRLLGQFMLGGIRSYASGGVLTDDDLKKLRAASTAATVATPVTRTAIAAAVAPVRAVAATAPAVAPTAAISVANQSTVLRATGDAVIAGLVKGMTDATTSNSSKIKRDVVNPLIKLIQDPLGIASPSKLTQGFGASIVDGLRKGMADKVPAISTVTGDIVKRIGTVSTSAAGIARGVGTATTTFVGHMRDMAKETEGSTGRVVRSQSAQALNTTLLAANHVNRTGQIIRGTQGIAKEVESSTGRVNKSQGAQAVNTTLLAMNHLSRTNQVAAGSRFMAGQSEGATGRVAKAQVAQAGNTTLLALNHITRTNQIAAGARNMAGQTETSVKKVNSAHDAMQRSVNALHGKNIAISSTASVKYPPDAQLAGAVKHAADIIGKAVSSGTVAVANGGIFMRRAEGGIDRLPGSAVIAPGRGSGMVQWAEGETGGEAFIPLAPAKRDRSMQIWKETGRLLGAFFDGGLVNVATTLDAGSWGADTGRLQSVSELAATVIGHSAADVLGRVAGETLGSTITQAVQAMVAAFAPHGPGTGLTGQWAAGILPWVKYITQTLNVSGLTYDGHHPDEGHALDLAVGQAGMINTAPATGPSGNDLYSNIAKWVEKEILGKPTPGWYTGVHAAIKSRGGSWHPAGDQLGTRGQTHSHDDHVHISFDPRYGGPMFGIPGNSSQPGYSWDEGHGPPAIAGGAGLGAAVGGGPIGGHFSQAQVEAAMRAVGASPDIAHIFSAIAMHENPASTRIHNDSGWYDSVYALQEAWTIPMGLDINRLNTDLMYATQVAYNLYQKSGFGPWEAYTNGSYRASMADGGILGPQGPGVVQWAEQSTGGEAYIPLTADASQRGRSVDIWRETGRLLGQYARGGIRAGDEDWGRDKRLLEPFGRAIAQAVQQLPPVLTTRAIPVKNATMPAPPAAAAPDAAKPPTPGTPAPLPKPTPAPKPVAGEPRGPGASYYAALGWAPGVLKWVQKIAQHFGILASTYYGHQADQGHAVDLAVGQFGMISNVAAGNAVERATDPYSKIAQWVERNVVTPGPGWYIGSHASIHNRFRDAPGAWRPIASQIGRRGQTFAHDDHVHLSFPKWFGNPGKSTKSSYASPQVYEDAPFVASFMDMAAGGISGLGSDFEVKPRLLKYDSGGLLPKGVTLTGLVNNTGKPERVVAPSTDDKTVNLLVQLTGLMAEQNQLLRRLPGASADALNSVAYRAAMR